VYIGALSGVQHVCYPDNIRKPVSQLIERGHNSISIKCHEVLRWVGLESHPLVISSRYHGATVYKVSQVARERNADVEKLTLLV
jgi:hypothetical protein